MSKSLAFMWLAEQGFNYSVHGEMGFNVLTKTIDACSCHELRYSKLDEAVAAFSQTGKRICSRLTASPLP